MPRGRSRPGHHGGTETPAETFRDGDLTLTRRQSGESGELVAAVAGSLTHVGTWLIWATGGYSADDAAQFFGRTAKHWESGEAYEYAVRLAGSLAGG